MDDRNDKAWESLIDDILYGDHESPYSRGDALLRLMYRFAEAKNSGGKSRCVTDPATDCGCECDPCDDSANGTVRRVLVEQIKSFAERDKVGDSDDMIISYEYGNSSDLMSHFDITNMNPSRVVMGDANYASFTKGKVYNRLQLEAHIKSLTAILDTLE